MPGQAFAEGMGQKSRSAAPWHVLVREGEGEANVAEVIFSCSYGDGHKSAQSAVEAFLKAFARRSRGIRVSSSVQAADFQVHSVDTTRDPRFEECMTPDEQKR